MACAWFPSLTARARPEARPEKRAANLCGLVIPGFGSYGSAGYPHAQIPRRGGAAFVIPMCETLWLMDLAASSASAIALALPNIVAFLSAAVAGTAVYVNRKMARDTLRQQLLLTHDERIWQQRSEAYLQLSC
jgi:hypothetical protein